ncbi:hypothetical protein GCM10009555_011360 [Acrocarpospora macrocephala]|uniref:Uncharacterized protein n=1 Tax=Acrocarpospora macrocephala TaxID=150177 RepID=A0A5M3WQS6_9ACTN|nr:hypothetical protein Amac_048510 [Acrocarpospora macrocephala]
MKTAAGPLVLAWGSSWPGIPVAGAAFQAGMYPDTVNGPEGECSADGGEVATGAERGMGTDTLEFWSPRRYGSCRVK